MSASSGMRARFFYGDDEVNCVNHSVSLELHPHTVCATSRESEIELNLRGTICNQGMGMRHIDQVVTGRQHVAHAPRYFSIPSLGLSVKRIWVFIPATG